MFLQRGSFSGWLILPLGVIIFFSSSAVILRTEQFSSVNFRVQKPEKKSASFPLGLQLAHPTEIRGNVMVECSEAADKINGLS